MNRETAMTSGHFWGLTPDHVKLFEYMKSLSAEVKAIVAVNGGAAHLKKKGSLSIPTEERIMLVRAVRYVDEVISFDEEDPCEIIRTYRPTYWVKGPDYKDVDIPERAVCAEVGTQLLFRPGSCMYHSSGVFAGSSSV